MDLSPYSRFASVSQGAGALLVALSLALFGCTGKQDYQTVTSEDADHAEAHVDDHHHHHAAPHGGHLIELGDHKFNAEVVLEADPKQLVIYLFDAHAENPVAIASESLQFSPEEGDPIVFQPSPQDGDAEGQSSRFVAAGGVIDSFADLEDLHGSMKVTIEEIEYTGQLSHDHDHGEHHEDEHDHDEGDHKHAEGDTDEQ